MFLHAISHRVSWQAAAVGTSLLALLVSTACAAQDPLLPGLPPPACVMPTGPLPGAAVTVTVNPGIRYQTIAGFGTTIRLFDDPHLTETFDPVTQRGAVVIPPVDQGRILVALYSDLHLTRVRYATETGVEPTNDNADPAVTDLSRFDFRWKKLDDHAEYVQAARPLGVTAWFGAPIGIELWMSRSDPAEYVEWAMAIIRRWRDLGATLPYWSIVNEPGYITDISGSFLRDAVKLLGAKLAAEGIATKLVIPDDLNPTTALARAQVVLADPVARQYVGAIAFHLYDATFPPAQPNTTSLAALSALARQYAIPLWMTEWYNPDWFTWARTMHSMLADYDVAAVDYLWGFLGQWEKIGSQLITINSSGSAYTGFTKNKQYWAMGHWSRFVPPGAIRVQASSSDAAVLATAWLVGEQLVVVALNVGGGEKSVQVALGAGSPCVRTMTSERSSSFETARVLDPVTLTGAGFTTGLPATSVTTFVLAR